MALVSVVLKALIFEPGALTTFFFLFYRSICILGNGASRRRTPNARLRARRADHSTSTTIAVLSAANFQIYEYNLSEIFITCGTYLNTKSSKYLYLSSS